VYPDKCNFIDFLICFSQEARLLVI